LIVPKLANYCAVHMLDESEMLWQVAVAHSDLALAEQVRALGEHCAIDLSQPHGVAQVLRSGHSMVVAETPDELLRSCSCNDEQFELLKSMGLSGAIIVPLNRLGRTLGTMALFSSNGLHPYAAAQLSVAEALAERASLALENARLYGTAQKARIEAERANRAKDKFLAMLSHELRTPLTPVLSTVLALEYEEDLPASMRAPLAMIRRNVELEARLIDDLLDLTRISKGKVQLNLERTDAHQLLRNALEICGPDIADKQLRVATDLAATQHYLDADPARLQQIFWNLIKNAVKFTSAGGRLAVSTRNLPDHQLEIEIADSGIGIAQEALSKIFDAFEQGDHVRFGGVGLGLAISKTLADLHGGTICAHSDGAGHGSKFSVRFPTSAGVLTAAAPRTNASAVHSPRKTASILLVEDHEDTNQSLVRLLQRRGYRVSSAIDVKSALEAAGADHFDVLVSDMGLPDGSGLDVMQKLSASNGAIFGIAVSGYGMESDIRKSHEAGFQHHLIKPIDLNQLDELIQERALADVPSANGGDPIEQLTTLKV
jgi:signal transduction histidine kinase/ActR/RegA family two-component response regulator